MLGHPLVLVPGSLPGRLVSTPVLDYGEIAATAGDNKDDNHDDDDNDDNNNKDGDDKGKQ